MFWEMVQTGVETIELNQSFSTVGYWLTEGAMGC